MLIHLNGPPGVGKSTVAELLVDSWPLSLCLDVDALRVRLGGWREVPESKQLARDLAIGTACSHLERGYNVVLPQLTVRPEVIESFKNAASTAGAEFVEVILVAREEEIVRRFGPSPVPPDHPRGLLTAEEAVSHVRHFVAHLGEIIRARPSARVVDVSAMGPHEAAAAVKAVLD